MSIGGQSQAVPRDILEKKVGRKLSPGDSFSTKTGLWEVTSVVVRNDIDVLIVERIADVSNG